MKRTKFYVVWTYSANHRILEVYASTAQEASEKATGFFPSVFQKTGSVFVFDSAPAFMWGPDAERLTTHGWRNYVIRPQYGNRWGMAQSFYAPSLDDAFAQARAQWPVADSWQSVGGE